MAATRGSTPSLLVEMPPRPALVPVAGAACGLVLLALLVLDLPAGVRLGLLVATAMLAVTVRRVATRLAAPARLECDASGRWRADGDASTVRPDTVVLPDLVVLSLRGTRTRRYWIRRRDADPVTFRRLKMRLRHVPGLQGPQPGARTPLLESRDAAG